MDENEKYSLCNIKRDKDNYKKDKTVCKNCYNKKKRKNNDNTLIKNQQPKIDNVNKNSNNQSIRLVVPCCLVEMYIMLKILHEYKLIEIFT